MSGARQALGRLGEDLACRELARRGYRILARRYRSRGGELDLVAHHRDALVFVEVKARQSEAFGDPAGAVTPRKQQRLAALAAEYLHRHGLEGEACRFDVVTVVTGGGDPRVEVIEDAFRPGWS